jgi:hypothetical protein
MDWQVLGSQYFRQIKVFSMRWDESIDLSSSISAFSTFAGPVAITRDTTQLTQLTSSSDDVTIFSCSGKILSRVARDMNAGRLVHLAWSAQELLYVIYETGVVDV